MKVKIEKLLTKMDYYLYQNWYSFHKVLTEKMIADIVFPTLRIMRRCMLHADFKPEHRVNNLSVDYFTLLMMESGVEFTVESLSNKYSITRERVRQILAKFVRENYNG